MSGQRVVAGVDGSPESDLAVRWAARIAAQRRLPLHIVHAIHVAGLYYGGGGMSGVGAFIALAQEDAAKMMNESIALARAVGPNLTVTSEMPSIAASSALIELSRDAKLVVVGKSGRGEFTGMLVGSTAAAVISHAHCSVAVIRHRPDVLAVPAGGPVVVGVDAGPNSDHAIALAFEEASQRRAPLVALHAWSDVTYDSTGGATRVPVQWESIEEDERRAFAERMAGWGEKYPDVEVHRELVRDRPRHALLEQAEKAQLVVVGSRGRGGFRGMLLGSTSQALVHFAACPVLVARPYEG
ncbi:Nucleotide-binding universal stress protein, UspA family [Amycolatopsis xylanica]|uniref:Nucleotide-binding universal stress protein, UspA family n=1 Tax=Amycolatopsis xylanica TaxID=589385 RepID=A0A1H3SDL3_9PSEU|nr:universal stress protein [Amycolatopsis xylanica]SDZ36153.1 Nucleotide-binding universal stress protein, UspA family [Amycolatopsis xylanica]